jgi:ribonucleoside-diphosphate reductase 2, operon protein nrdI
MKKIVYASRTGNVESIIQKLEINDTIKLETGIEVTNEEFILFTYTDGYGDVPMEVESFLTDHKELIKGVIVSGDLSYGEAYCEAGDIISKEYQIPCLYKVENDGTDEDIIKIKEIIENL